jgi:hypothetical protein
MVEHLHLGPGGKPNPYIEPCLVCNPVQITANSVVTEGPIPLQDATASESDSEDPEDPFFFPTKTRGVAASRVVASPVVTVTHHSHIRGDDQNQNRILNVASLRLPPGITVLGLKQQLIDEHGWPKNHEDWTLIFAGRLLDWEHHHRLMSLYAPAGGTFHSILRRDRDPDRQVLLYSDCTQTVLIHCTVL